MTFGKHIILLPFSKQAADFSFFHEHFLFPGQIVSWVNAEHIQSHGNVSIVNKSSLKLEHLTENTVVCSRLLYVNWLFNRCYYGIFTRIPFNLTFFKCPSFVVFTFTLQVISCHDHLRIWWKSQIISLPFLEKEVQLFST